MTKLKAICWRCEGDGRLNVYSAWNGHYIETVTCPNCYGRVGNYFELLTYVVFGICGMLLAAMIWNKIFG